MILFIPIVIKDSISSRKFQEAKRFFIVNSQLDEKNSKSFA